jgi:hypothetical protein
MFEIANVLGPVEKQNIRRGTRSSHDIKSMIENKYGY